LGRSLGIDLVPYKTCSYDCVYCQLGRTTTKTVRPRKFVSVEAVLEELEEKLAGGDDLDHISLAGCGEPTLNSDVGDLILKIRRLTRIPIAVLTNGSLLWMNEVQDALMSADLVLPSLDAGDAAIFEYVNRPHKSISFDLMTNGLASFAERFRGSIWVEVFLLYGVTGILHEVEKIAGILAPMKLGKIQLNTVTRPAAEKYAKPVPYKQMMRLAGRLPGHVEIIGESIGRRRGGASGRELPDEEILSLIGRRPCTCSDIARGLGLNLLETSKRLGTLVACQKARTVRQGARTFYVPNF